MSENLELKSIGELLEMDFYIPSYQRGYRWDTRQVEDLLEDFLEFINNKERSQLSKNEFYCLQPIVVKYDDEIKRYKIIDGQQRLTTIYIILKYLENARQYYDKKKTIYSIKYETREEDANGSEFLVNINDVEEVHEDNIDYYYMSKAYLTIKEWFTAGIANEVDFLKILLKNDIKSENNIKTDLTNNVRVIWYEIEDSENEIDVFTRLNIGKISLTNGELIKALFLLAKDGKKLNEKIILATQWDNIEYKLQNNTFFAFINGEANKYAKPTRIEFIFNLITSNIKTLKIDNLKTTDEKYSYYIFDRLLHNEDDFKKEFDVQEEEHVSYDERVEFLWDKVKTYFRIFEEFYEDDKENLYYHLVGYLVNNGVSINEISFNFAEKSKKMFLQYLQKEILQLVKSDEDKQLETITYKKNYDLITRILFLLNVVSTIKSGYSKYPFDLHTKENWSLEHIHPQNPESLSDSDKKELLASYKKYASPNLQNEIEDGENGIENIDELLTKILAEQGEDIHTIDNMALLSKEKNSSLSNSLFIQKRQKVIEWDKNGEFIPIGTKNVFLKYYTDTPESMKKWDNDDKKAYISKLKTLYEYIKELNND